MDVFIGPSGVGYDKRLPSRSLLSGSHQIVTFTRDVSEDRRNDYSTTL